MTKNRTPNAGKRRQAFPSRVVVEAMESRTLMTAAINHMGGWPDIAFADSNSAQRSEKQLSAVVSTKTQSPTKSGGSTTVSPPAVLLNEIEANPPGTDDNRYEYVELSGATGLSLTNVYFVAFDGVAGKTGIADLVVNLSGFALGSDGLLVIQSSATTGHSIPAATTLVSNPTFFTKTGGFVNGSLSFFLYYSPSAAFVAGTDYDTNDNGALDHLPAGAVALDNVANPNTNNTGTDIVYGGVQVTEQASQNLGTADGMTRFPGNGSTTSAAWYGGELYDVGNVDSTINYDVTREAANEPANAYLTPGAVNYPLAPAFNPTTYSFNVQKTAIAGTLVGAVSATPGGTDTLAYGLSGTGSSNFSISGGGAITVASGAALSGTSYSLTVTARDNQNSLTSAAPVTIAVFSAPVFNPTSYSLSILQTLVAGASVGTVSATAEGSDTITYGLSGTGSANFVIGGGGAITVAGGAMLSGPGYSLTVTAKDNQNNDAATASAAVAVIWVSAFSGLSAPSSIAYGTATTTFTGVISAGSQSPPTSETVGVELNGVTINAAIGVNGALSATFNTSALPVSATPYQVRYSYAGDANFSSTTANSTTTLTVTAAGPILEASQVGDGSAQRSTIDGITIVFSEAVNLGASSFTLSYETAADNLALQNGQVTSATYTALSNSNDLTFASSDGGITWIISCKAAGAADRLGAADTTGDANGFGIFADGVYALVLHGAHIADAATGSAFFNNSMDSTVQFADGGGTVHNSFAALYGDLGGAGDVNANDSKKMGTALGKSLGTTGYLAALDFTGTNAGINANDSKKLAKNLSVQLLLP